MIKWKKEIFEIDRLSRIYPFITIPLFGMFLYALVTNSFIEFIENNKGLFTLLSIVFALGYFIETSASKNRDYILNQINLVRNLLMRLEYLGGEGVMLIFNKQARISLLEWYYYTINSKSFPTHKIKEIDADFFTNNLDYKIRNKPTFELKKAIYLIDYKIIMINFWHQEVLELLETLELEKSKANKKQILKTIEKYKGFILEPLNDLKQLVPEVKTHIEKEFDISLNK